MTNNLIETIAGIVVAIFIGAAFLGISSQAIAPLVGFAIFAFIGLYAYKEYHS